LPHDPVALVQHIRRAFERTPHPGDRFLQGSFEGCEPGEAVEPFRGVSDWISVAAPILDANYNALSFFSEGAFRYFLPAFMTADVREELSTADPVFHLTGGFHEIAVEVPAGTTRVTRRSGGSVLLNPRRYGAMSYEDYARFRLSVFSREECAGIVAYLAYRRDRDTTGLDRAAIEAALERFWNDRAAHAPPASALERHVEEEQRFISLLSRDS
jgi:hypothetical protein